MLGGGKQPRVVLVTRPTERDRLVAEHGTPQWARFRLRKRAALLDSVDQQHTRVQQAIQFVLSTIPAAWRRARVDRSELDRFLFEPEDVIVVLGQDGLVANVAKYLEGQPVIGLNPMPEQYEGVLVPHPPGAAGDLILDAVRGRAHCEARTMVVAESDDGQVVRALNEVFLGHRGHQSARYRLELNGRTERQSSSGVIVSTGTGSTGWLRSIRRQHRAGDTVPELRPTDAALVFFVREPWPSRTTGVELDHGYLDAGQQLVLVSEMETGGTAFGDGIESDHLAFDWGRQVTVRVGSTCLQLVTTR